MTNELSVCLLGITGETLDEGMKNYSNRLYAELEDRVAEVELIDLGTLTAPGTLRSLNAMDPQVLHLIPGPTTKGLALLKLLGGWLDAATVVSALHPTFFPGMESLLPLLTPDLVLVQSQRWEQAFRSAGATTTWMPSGVDIQQFQPVSSEEKHRKRAELGFPTDDPLFLHVGHLKKKRNVLDLIALQEHGTVVIIGSTSTEEERDVRARLERHGCYVLTEYLENIEDYYQMADYYVFPTTDAENSIQLPLSVFEAMACNLPVISTPFGGLPQLFSEGDGLRFVKSVQKVTQVDLPHQATVETRAKVVDYSWDNIAANIAAHYDTL